MLQPFFCHFAYIKCEHIMKNFAICWFCLYFQLSMDLLANYPAGYNVLPGILPHTYLYRQRSELNGSKGGNTHRWNVASSNISGMLWLDFSSKCIHISTLQRHNTENLKQIFQKRNRMASVLISTFMCLWAIYLFPWSICLFCRRKICGPILEIFK